MTDTFEPIDVEAILDEWDPGWRDRPRATYRRLSNADVELTRSDFHHALSLLIGLPHPDSIPASWRPDSGRTDPLMLSEVVDLLCRHLGPNSVGKAP